LIFLRTIIIKHAPFSNLYESLIFFSLIYALKIIITNLKEKKIYSILLLPVIISLIIGIFLPYSFKKPDALIPVLKSIWMFIHVPAFFIGYVSLSFAFVITIIGFFNKKDNSDLIENEIKLSFFFVAFGIITGAFWAEQSWTIFWSWDPKETWALILWLSLLAVLHTKHKTIKKIFIIFSFLIMLFTYFGVMFLIPGLHSYL
jgi:ABC-type transport system involved in cytochrome c biogenesis permease subunit